MKYLKWQLNAVDVSLSNPCSLGVTFPDSQSTPVALNIQSNAGPGNDFVIANLSFSIAGDSAAEILSWPDDSGLMISFNKGSTWAPVTATPLLMSGAAVSATGGDGRLNMYDVATISLRLQTPTFPTTFGRRPVEVAVDFDVW